MSEENGEATKITTPWGSITGKRTAELVSILSLCALGVMMYVLWDMKADARAEVVERKEMNANIVAAIKEFTSAQRESTKEQKVTNCLIATKGGGMLQLAECERIAR